MQKSPSRFSEWRLLKFLRQVHRIEYDSYCRLKASVSQGFPGLYSRPRHREFIRLSITPPLKFHEFERLSPTRTQWKLRFLPFLSSFPKCQINFTTCIFFEANYSQNLSLIIFQELLSAFIFNKTFKSIFRRYSTYIGHLWRIIFLKEL